MCEHQPNQIPNPPDRLSEIQKIATEALQLNKTIEENGQKWVEKTHPKGWLPPGKRAKLVAMLEQIEKLSSQS